MGESTLSRGALNMSATDAVDRLRKGNARFVANEPSAEGRRTRPSDVADGQNPFAIILGCSDSRVPAEIVFDQGIGDLFVIRVAGNIVAPSHIGSIEYGLEQFGVHLVVVLGHSSCGAVVATLQELERPVENRSPNLHSIVDRIRPAVEALRSTELKNEPEALLAHAVRANINASVNQLKRGSQILEGLIHDGELMVVGAEYSLETGHVDFFDLE